MTAPRLGVGESWEPGAMVASELVAEVVDRAGYTHIGTLAGRLPLRTWLEDRGARYDWPMVFRDGFTSDKGPALICAFIENPRFPGEQISGVFPLYREGRAS